MTRSRLLLLGLLAAVPSATAATAPATASAASTSSNWAGYAVRSHSGARFRRVSGTWVQPAVNCTSARPAYSAFWVGLGGESHNSSALEQIGTEADCSATGTVSYRAWYELVPTGPLSVHIGVRPGDAVSASVTVTGTRVSLRMADVTRGTSFARQLRMRSPDLSSAEWIAEAPSACSGGGSCATLPLADFGSVAFTAAAATAAGHTGPIVDAAWTPTAITMRDLFSFDGPARFAGATSAAEADPGALSSGGSGFSVTWKRLQGNLGPSPGGLGPSGAGPGVG